MIRTNFQPDSKSFLISNVCERPDMVLRKPVSGISFVVLTTLLVAGFPNYMIQEADASLTSVVIDSPANDAVVGNQGSPSNIIGYTLADNLNAAADSVTITLTPISGGSTLTCLLNAAGGETAFLAAASGGTSHDLSRTELEGAGCFGASITEGIQYHVDLDADEGGAGGVTSATRVTPVTFDFTAPTGFTASGAAGSNTITLTWNEAVDSAQTPANLANAFSLSGTELTITSASDPADSATMTLTLSGNISRGEIIQVSYDADQANGDVEDAATTNANQASDVNNVSVSGIIPGGGGSGCEDCEEPTLGILSNGQRIVDDGFTYNGHSIDVERFFTPYPLITAQVGKQNTAVFKIYENRGPDNIAHFSFAFGLGKGEIISQSRAMIEIDFARDRTQTVTITDPENALDNVSVTTDKVACNGGPAECLQITINHMFRESLDFNIVGTDVWDYSRQSWQNYYNHGIEVVGESINPPKEYGGVYKGHIYHLTETGKATAIDEFGDSWTFQYGKWNKDYVKQEKIQDSYTNVMTRTHSNFETYKENQANKALQYLLEMCPVCVEKYADFEEPFSMEYGNQISKLNNIEIQKIMKFEAERSQEILD